MDLVDLIVILFAISAFIRGLETGSIRQVFSAGGFFLGLFVGAMIQPHFIHYAHTPISRTLLTVSITLGTAVILLGVGEYVGLLIKKKIRRFRLLEKADRGVGGAVGAATFLITVWFAAALLVGLPFPGLQDELRGSAIVGFLNKNLPPAPNVIASLSHAIDPNGFPRVFTGLEPPPPSINAPLPPLGSMAPAVHKDLPSVVKVEGEGCGGIVEGSGFVAAPGLIATNAHVIAGVRHPVIFDSDGKQHSATPIWFDPNLDFAVLSINGLHRQPLVLYTKVAPNGTRSVVLGYPGGGGFNAQPSIVLDEFTATGRNIYDRGITERDVYEVKANVVPGNSGGPLILADGRVAGIIFAQSTVYNHVGYALTMQQVANELHQAESRHAPVSTGACAE